MSNQYYIASSQTLAISCTPPVNLGWNISYIRTDTDTPGSFSGSTNSGVIFTAPANTLIYRLTVNNKDLATVSCIKITDGSSNEIFSRKINPGYSEDLLQPLYVKGEKGEKGETGTPGISGESFDSSLYTLLTTTASISGGLNSRLVTVEGNYATKATPVAGTYNNVVVNSEGVVTSGGNLSYALTSSIPTSASFLSDYDNRYVNESDLTVTLGNYTLLTTTASISGNLQTQINTKQSLTTVIAMAIALG